MYIQVPWSVFDQAMKETESMWQKQEWFLSRDLMSLSWVQTDEGAIGGYIWHLFTVLQRTSYQCCICKLFNYSESPNNARHPLCIWHIVFTGKSCNKTFPDGSIYDSCLVYFVSMVMHVFGFSPPGKPGEYVGENRGMDWFLPFPFKFKGKVKGGGALKGSLCWAVPLRPSSPDPV